MAVDINTIGLGVDTREVKEAIGTLSQFGKSADTASKKADDFGTSNEKAEKKVSGLSQASGLAVGAIGKLAGAFGAYQVAAKTIDSLDSFTRINAQIKLATKSQAEFNESMRNVSSIAKAAQSDLTSVATLYARLNNNLRDMGIQQSQVAQISETVALALKAQGASTEEAASSMLQLSQAFGKGKLDGDELKSMLESAPNLMRALAESAGVTFGALKDMGAQGLITSEMMVKAFTNPELLDAYRTQAKEVETIGGAWQTVKNNIMLAIGAADEYLGLSGKIKEKLGNAAELFAPQTKGQKIYSLQEQINALDRKGIAGSPYSKKYIESEKARLRAEYRKLNGSESTGSTFSGLNPNGNIAPNFGSTVVVQDIREIHKLQEEQKRLADQRSSDAKKLYDEKLKALQDEISEEFESTEAIYAFKSKAQEDLNKAMLKDIQDEIDEEFELKEASYKREYELMEERTKKAKQEADKVARQNEQVAKEFSQALTNGLFDSFKKGESFGKAMLSNLLALAKTWAARLFDGLLSPIGSGIASIFTGGAASLFSGTASAASSGGGSIFSGLSSIGNLFSNGNAAIVSSIESLGTFLSTGTGGLGDMIGGALGQYAGQISNVLPFAGAALNLLSGNVNGAIGSALGAALTFTPLGPVGGIIGSFLGSALGGLFGGKSRADTNRSRVFVSASNEGGYKDLGYRQGGGNNLMSSAISPLQGLNQQFIGSLQILLNAFGAKDKLNLTSFFDVKNRATGQIFGDINGVKFTDAVQGGKKSAGQAQEIFDRFVEKVLGSTIVDAIKLSSLSSGVKKFFDGLTKKEDVLTAINTLASLNAALKDLPPVFDAIRNAIETTSYKTSIADLNTRFAAINTYTSLFYTQAEQFDTFTKQLTSQFDALGKTLPETREGFRALVDGITVTDKTTSDLFNGLVALAPAADAYYKQLLEQKGALQSLSTDLFSNASDYLYASALAGKGMNYTAQIGEIGTLNRAGDAGLNMVVQTLVNAQADTKALLEAVVKAVAETARLQKIWNGDGLPETRVI